MKKCTRCLITKDFSQFYKEPRSKKDGVQSRCKECQRKYLYSHRKTSRGKATQRKYNLKYYYGITPEEYDYKLKQQDGVCAICKKSSTINLAVDHCHKTGKIRGLLCSTCNTTLGLIEESRQWFKRADDYLEFYS